MKKGDGPNSGVEFFYKLSHKPEFQQDLIRARKQLGISEKGFIDPKTREKLWIEHKDADMLGLLGAELHLKEKYKIPIPYLPFIDDYIFFGKPMNALKNKPQIARIDYPGPPNFESIEKFYDANNEPYVKLFVFGNATKTKVVDFIKKNWREIELGLNKNIHKKERVRETIFKDRAQAIRALWRLPLQELQKESGSSTKERSLLVAKVLVKRGATKTELNDGYIRKIANER